MTTSSIKQRFYTTAPTAILMLVSYAAGANIERVSNKHEPKPCPVTECQKSVQKVEVVPTVEVVGDPPDPAPMPLVVMAVPQWLPVNPNELKNLEGKWIEAKGLPLPTFEFVVGREGSRTPYNIRFQTEKLQGGCGIDQELRAWCKVHDDGPNKKVPRAERHVAEFSLSGTRLRVVLGQTATLDLVRAP